MIGRNVPRRDWGRIDRNTPRAVFDQATRATVGDLAGEIAARPVIEDLERMLAAEADRQLRARNARGVQRGEPGA